MEKRYFSLSTGESNRFVSIVRIIFGTACVAVAIFWLVFNIRSLAGNGALWITIIFLLGFGLYMILSGLGFATRFIEIDSNSIRLKKYPLLAPVEINAGNIDRIESLPLHIIFYMKEKKRILLRFGTTWYETNSEIVDEISLFSEANNIHFEIVEEKL